MFEPCVVYITAGSAEEAEIIARTLVEERLAACCSVVPGVGSTYRWQGAVLRETEQLLICKSASHLFRSLEQRVRALHSYEVPEILRLPVAEASAPYLAWMREELLPE